MSEQAIGELIKKYQNEETAEMKLWNKSLDEKEKAFHEGTIIVYKGIIHDLTTLLNNIANCPVRGQDDGEKVPF